MDICSLMKNNETETSINDYWSIWKNTMMTALHKCIPTKYVDPRRLPPCANDETQLDPTPDRLKEKGFYLRQNLTREQKPI